MSLMKLLMLDDYQSSSNTLCGISEEKELQMTGECITFIQKMAEHFKIQVHVIGTAMTIFHLYQKKYPYTEFDRFMLSALCLFLACKIDYIHVKYFDFIQFYYSQKRGPKNRIKPFDEIKEQLREDFVDLEFKVLSTITFDFEFDSPFEYLNVFRNSYFLNEIQPITKEYGMNQEQIRIFQECYENFIQLAKKLLQDSYLHPFCLYFPAPIITAACLLLANLLYNKTNYTIDKIHDTQELGRNILQKYNIRSFLKIEVLESSLGDEILQQENKWLINILPKHRQANERISIIDVVFVGNEILNKIIEQISD